MRNYLILGTLCFSLSLNASAQKTGSDHPPTAPASNTYEKVSHQFQAGAAESEIADFIRQNKPMLAETGSDIMLETYRQSLGGHHYTFVQTFRGIPIYDASIKANLTQGMRMMSLLNNLRTPNGQVQGQFTKTLEDAEAWATQQYQQSQTRFSLSTTAKWWFDQGTLIPVWVVETDGDQHALEVILNANDLSEIRVKDRAVYCHPDGGPGKTSVDSSGTGMVWNPDPLTTAGVPYGGLYVDSNDQNSAALNDERVSVTLQGISFNGGVFSLSGPHVSIEDALETPTNTDPTSTDGNFNFLRADQGFESVMCYYHIDHYQRYIQSLGFNNIYNSPLKCDPHGLSGQDNSHFVPNGTNSRVAFGEGGVDDAEDADVIIHEYGHALSYSASPNSNSGSERNGLDEGIGDYLATSYSRGLSTYRWDDMFTWDGHNSFWPGRDATDAMQYPPSGFNFYDYGEIWNTALSIAWGNVGQTVCDRVVFQELFMNSGNMTLNDAAHLILDADTMLYSGVNTNHFQAAFCQKNIFQGVECIVSVDDRITEDFRWNLYPNPANQEALIVIPGYRTQDGWGWELMDMSGKIMQSGKIQDYTTQLPISQLSDGIYLVRMQDAAGTQSTRKLMVAH
jgi:hypothetical protein